ncbi:Saccharopine dehydrogenase-domain-containing protein [Dactylonectria estremocensis]|uniref:Saccharopine dehydrogenase-domain-containing protein n=1 Tax=Dactylonectria estremocensis TaxID=1079267 RepID=A0A9P9F7Y5_9HYPO|nr:Saccharopine dehydrogenase-domain-containing protein [Dactylonectria estremocensis]
MTEKILILGSGMVAKPCLDYLLRNDSNILTVGDLDSHIAAHGFVISLIPFVHHALVIRAATKAKTHVVTASYVSSAMRELDEEAKEASITILNEAGVDPGIDHLFAIKIIGDVHDKEGKHNSATFLQDGKVVNISNKDLMGKAQPYHVMDGYSFVAYPNRDSLPFREPYGVPEAHTVIRGLLRCEGNPALVKALIDTGLIDTEDKPWLKDGMTW